MEGSEAGAVLGPGSYWFCLSSEKAFCRVMAPADWDKPEPWAGDGEGAVEAGTNHNNTRSVDLHVDSINQSSQS